MRAESDISVSLFCIPLVSGYELAFIVNQNGKTRFTSRGKLMIESQFCNLLDPGAKDKKKPRCDESRRTVLNQAQD